jgi:hypothetical protein
MKNYLSGTEYEVCAVGQVAVVDHQHVRQQTLLHSLRDRDHIVGDVASLNLSSPPWTFHPWITRPSTNTSQQPARQGSYSGWRCVPEPFVPPWTFHPWITRPSTNTSPQPTRQGSYSGWCCVPEPFVPPGHFIPELHVRQQTLLHSLRDRDHIVGLCCIPEPFVPLDISSLNYTSANKQFSTLYSLCRARENLLWSGVASLVVSSLNATFIYIKTVYFTACIGQRAI